jgi:hypothetical protein
MGTIVLTRIAKPDTVAIHRSSLAKATQGAMLSLE